MSKLLSRQQVPEADTWDLASLFADDAAWEKAFTRYQKLLPKMQPFQGTLAESAATLAACLDLECQLDRLAERLGVYAYL